MVHILNISIYTTVWRPQLVLSIWIPRKNCSLRTSKCLCHFDVLQTNC